MSINLRYPEIEVMDDGIYEKQFNSKGQYIGSIYVSKVMSIVQKRKDLDNDSYTVELEYVDITNHQRRRNFPLESISDMKKIISLAKQGVDVNSYNASAVFRHLQNELSIESNCINETIKVGFIDKNLKYFNAGKIFGVEIDKVKVKSEYVYTGRLNLTSKGDFKEYQQIVQEELLGHTALEMALAIGFTGPLIPLLQPYTEVKNLLIHTSGQSTTGKSTASKIVASVFAGLTPSYSKPDTVFRSWHTTENGLESMLADNFGIPIIIDELGKLKIRNNETLDNLIYNITEGMGKGRSVITGEGIPVKTWSTTMFSNGERTLFENTSNADGLRMRVLDLRHIAYTESAEQAERLGYRFSTCNGIAGKKFIQKLLMLSGESLIDKFNRIRDSIAKRLPTIPQADRIAKLPAYILLAVELLSEFKMFNLDYTKIADLLVNNISCNTGEQVGIVEKALDAIMQIISLNDSRFHKKVNNQMYVDEIQATNGDAWGILSFNELDELYEIVIICKVLQDQLKSYDFNNLTTVFHELKINGYLDFEEKKTYRKRTINTTPVSCYVIKIKNKVYK